MKRGLILLITLTLSISSFAANPEKQYNKLINNFDVADEAKAVEKNAPAEFWQTMLDHNALLKKFGTDIQKNRGAEKEALQETAQIPRFYPQYEESVIEEMQGFCDTLLINMGIADLHLKCSLHIVYSNEVNAFTALTEEGFAMCLTSGLLQRKGITYDILKGYVAHEFAHGALFHHVRSSYAVAKERRKNKLLGGIAAALNATAAVLETHNAATYGIQPSGVDYGVQIENIDKEVKMSTAKYSFKYSQEQEYEADLIAFRFLQNSGNGEAFIDGLRILGSDYDDCYSEFNDHPTTVSRINFLKYVKDNPQLGNTFNQKQERKKAKQIEKEKVSRYDSTYDRE